MACPLRAMPFSPPSHCLATPTAQATPTALATPTA